MLFFPRQGPLHGSLAWLSPCNPIAAQKTPAHFHNYSVSSFLYHCIPCKPPSKASSNVTFIPLPVPQIDGLPLGVESTSELPMHKVPHQKSSTPPSPFTTITCRGQRNLLFQGKLRDTQQCWQKI